MKTAIRIRHITFTGLLAALTAILSVISFPIPISPVPVTLGIVAVFISSILLPPWQAALSQLVYLLVGFVGVPVFSGFRAGPGVLLGPTGGYLLAYPFMAFLGSLIFYILSNRYEHIGNTFLLSLFTAISLLASLCVCYLFGVLWFSFTQGVTIIYAFGLTIAPFIAVDLLKIAFCVVFMAPAAKRIRTSKYINT